MGKLTLCHRPCIMLDLIPVFPATSSHDVDIKTWWDMTSPSLPTPTFELWYWHILLIYITNTSIYPFFHDIHIHFWPIFSIRLHPTELRYSHYYPSNTSPPHSPHPTPPHATPNYIVQIDRLFYSQSNPTQPNTFILRAITCSRSLIDTYNDTNPSPCARPYPIGWPDHIE